MNKFYSISYNEVSKSFSVETKDFGLFKKIKDKFKKGPYKNHEITWFEGWESDYLNKPKDRRIFYLSPSFDANDLATHKGGLHAYKPKEKGLNKVHKVVGSTDQYNKRKHELQDAKIKISNPGLFYYEK